LASVVAGKLQSLWSPEQIAGWLKRTYPDDETYQVSHETIIVVSSSRLVCLEEGVVAAFEAGTSHAPFAPPHPENSQSRQDHWRGVDQ